MAVFFSTTLVISIIGLISLLSIKRWEDAHGRVLLSGTRPFLGRMLGTFLHTVERRVPRAVREGSNALYWLLRRRVQKAIAWGVLYVEYVLEKVLHTIRHTTATHTTKEASPFLREVAEHKRNLLERADKEKNAIYEE